MHIFLRHQPKVFSQDLSRGALGNGWDEDDTTPQLLVLGNLLGHKALDLLGGDLFLVGHDVGAARWSVTTEDYESRIRILPGKLCTLTRDTNYGSVQNLRVGQQDSFELGWGHLGALVLDKFLSRCEQITNELTATEYNYLFSIDNVQPAITKDANIASVEPPVLESFRVGLGIVPVPLDDERAADQDLALLAGLDIVAVLVDELGVVAGDQAADGAGPEVRPVDGHRRDAARRLAEAPRLAQPGGAPAELLADLELQVLAHGRRARNGVDPRVELVRHQRGLGDQQVDGRHAEARSGLVLLEVLAELDKVKSRHPV